MVPSIEFRGQPFDDDSSSAAFLRRALADPSIDHMTFAVAWARYRGLARLAPDLEGFTARGGTLEIMVGIDEGGATRPGLMLCLRLATSAFVFHDPGGGTFHPKIYLAEGPGRAALLVGSSNTTPGGLFTNYEASLLADFVFPDERHHPALADVRGYLARLRQERELCVPLTQALIDALVKDRRYNVAGHERPRRSGNARPENDASEADSDQSGSDPDSSDKPLIFGRRTAPIVRPPPLSAAAARELAEFELTGDDEESGLDDPERKPGREPDRGQEEDAARPPILPPVPSRQTIKRWFKTLKPADAQQLSTSSPSAMLTLVQADHPIDRTTYFRDEFFGSADWTFDGVKEIAEIDCEIVIGGTRLGVKRMVVVHDPRLESGQDNRTTLLRWGGLHHYLLANDHVGDVVTLELLDDGRWRVTIASRATGEFVR